MRAGDLGGLFECHREMADAAGCADGVGQRCSRCGVDDLPGSSHAAISGQQDIDRFIFLIAGQEPVGIEYGVTGLYGDEVS